MQKVGYGTVNQPVIDVSNPTPDHSHHRQHVPETKIQIYPELHHGPCVRLCLSLIPYLRVSHQDSRLLSPLQHDLTAGNRLKVALINFIKQVLSFQH